jgi:hypothetical protein
VISIRSVGFSSTDGVEHRLGRVELGSLNLVCNFPSSSIDGAILNPLVVVVSSETDKYRRTLLEERPWE